VSDQNAFAALSRAVITGSSRTMPTNWCEPTCRDSHPLETEVFEDEIAELPSIQSTLRAFFGGAADRKTEGRAKPRKWKADEFETDNELIVVRIRVLAQRRCSR
jgi:hypothetical protein